MKKLIAGIVVVGLMSLSGFAADSGADLYKGKCQMCHGADGTPSAAMAKSMGLKDLKSDDVQKQSDADLKATVAKGKGKMTGFAGKLTDPQIDEVVKYVRSLKK
ncbi:MAG TPA: cytochrome c [Terriglobales bacterium]|nr:cytochrome c [Terriglobales bacterium]